MILVAILFLLFKIIPGKRKKFGIFIVALSTGPHNNCFTDSLSNGHRSPAARLGISTSNKGSRLVTTRLSPSEESPTPSRSFSFEWIPTRIVFEGVYRSYGTPTLWRKLTSSVPRREFALENLTLAFGKQDSQTINAANDDDHGDRRCYNEDALCLLLGASSSGKSTIFRSILDCWDGETTKEVDRTFSSAGNRGDLNILRLPLPGQPITTAVAKPILLDDRAEVNKSSGPPKATLRDAWMECMKGDATSGNSVQSNERSRYATALIEYLASKIFELNPEALLEELTPSERYRLCLGKACIQSGVHTINSSSSSNHSALPGPILLLDEWMDVETSAVVRKVQPSLHKIVEDLNGVVISITHKPELYRNGASSNLVIVEGSRVRRVTLSAGKLLSEH